MPEFDKKQYWDRRKKGLRGQVDPFYIQDRTSEEWQKHNKPGQHFNGKNRAQDRHRVRDHSSTRKRALISTPEQDKARWAKIARKEAGEQERIRIKKELAYQN